MASERILCTGTIVASGEIDWRISPLSGDIEISDGDIQRIIDEANDTADYADDIEDRTFWASGNW